METKEAILATISELSKESAESNNIVILSEAKNLNEQNRDSSPLAQNDKKWAQNDKLGENADSAKSVDTAEFSLDSAKKNAESSAESSNIFIDIKEEVEDIEGSDLDDEVALLLRLKEKSLVLFEGLKSAQNSDKSDVLAMKVEMVISYLEYQLFVIEERLEILKGENK